MDKEEGSQRRLPFLFAATIAEEMLTVWEQGSGDVAVDITDFFAFEGDTIGKSDVGGEMSCLMDEGVEELGGVTGESCHKDGLTARVIGIGDA